MREKRMWLNNCLKNINILANYKKVSKSLFVEVLTMGEQKKNDGVSIAKLLFAFVYILLFPTLLLFLSGNWKGMKIIGKR